jgi:glyoxylase-like metal-dependent hydrolase (beta-lactamase superfamily II)
MNYWSVIPLIFGYAHGRDDTPKVDKEGKELKMPYLGFYLTDGKHNIICDTGINESYIINGKTLGGFPTFGGESYIYETLRQIELEPEKIDMVIYTHLHNDHAGNSHVFQDAVHIFQDAEWKELIDPLPSMVIAGVFDPSAIDSLSRLKCQRVVGDVDLLDGLRLLHTPGHTAGGQSILLRTKNGNYLLPGDTIFCYYMAGCFMNFPEYNIWAWPDETPTTMTDEFKEWLRKHFTGFNYDHYTWFNSMYRLQTLVSGLDFILPAHEPSIVGKKYG